MDRRETIKSLLIGSLAGGLVINGCDPAQTSEEEARQAEGHYGRTPDEKARDEQLKLEQFFNEHELTIIAVLCDLILPANDNFGSASDAGVPEFIEFMAKDLPNNQLPIRGGLMWLDNRTNKLFTKEFKFCTDEQQKSILDEIAYPDKTKPELKQGEKFFTLMRNLTLTGYYTTKMGIDDLEYKGNAPNLWDGVPEEVLQEHGISYESEWLAKCINQNSRTDIARWDEDGNLLN